MSNCQSSITILSAYWFWPHKCLYFSLLISLPLYATPKTLCTHYSLALIPQGKLSIWHWSRISLFFSCLHIFLVSLIPPNWNLFCWENLGFSILNIRSGGIIVTLVLQKFFAMEKVKCHCSKESLCNKSATIFKISFWRMWDIDSWYKRVNYFT